MREKPTRRQFLGTTAATAAATWAGGRTYAAGADATPGPNETVNMALIGFLCFEEPCNTEWPDTFSGVCEYGPGPVAEKGFLLQYTFRGGCRQQRRSHGKLFCGSEASMILDRSGYTITAEATGGKKLGEEIDSFRGGGPNHAEVFVQNVRNHTRPFADVEKGHHASNPGHLMNIAWRVGRRIRWDAEKEQVVDDPRGQRPGDQVVPGPLEAEGLGFLGKRPGRSDL